jgi:transposase-like protein
MEATMERHKPYTTEYKLAAIKLAQTAGIDKTASNLGINANMLGRWKREYEQGLAQARSPVEAIQPSPSRRKGTNNSDENSKLLVFLTLRRT